jgi:hypothetical protein
MAKRKICQYCKHTMYSVKVELKPEGTYITYQCSSFYCSHSETVFEKRMTNKNIHANLPLTSILYTCFLRI